MASDATPGNPRRRRVGAALDRADPAGEGPEVSDTDEMWRACLALPRQQRVALALRFYEDLSFAQIAAILDCAEPTARSHVHRGLASLRRVVGRVPNGEGQSR